MKNLLFIFITLMATTAILVMSSCTTESSYEEYSTSTSTSAEPSAEQVSTSIIEDASIESEAEAEEAEATYDFENQDDQKKYEKNNESAANTSFTKFVGTYSFTYTKDKGRFNNSPIIVLTDGRCIVPYMTVGGDINPTYIGNISPISNTAFRITGTPKKFFFDMGWYNSNTGNLGEWTTHGMRVSEAVFDISEGRVYQGVTDYNNRDISTVYYTPFTHNNSTDY